MGNNSSRGAYPPQYPPKHAYYSDRPHQKPRKGGGGLGRRYYDEGGYDRRERYPSQSHTRSQSHSHYPHPNPFKPQHGYALPQPIPPPQLPFPNVVAPSPYPVIPPVPPRHHYSSSAPPPVIPNSSYFTHPTAQMPEPAVAPPPVIPHMHAQGAPVIPQHQGNMYQNNAPVVPPLPTMYPQSHPGNGGMHASMSSDSTTPPHNMQQGPPLAPGQYAHGFHHYERQPPIEFRENPLPTPPKDIFELSPYVNLLKDLQRPLEDTINTTSPAYATAYVVTPPGSYASREKKQRKGLFRTLSNRLGGKPKRDADGAPLVQPVFLTTGPVIPGGVFPGAVPGAVIPPGVFPAAVPPPGTFWPTGGPQSMQDGSVRAHSPHQHHAPPSPAPSHRSHQSHRSHHSRHSPQNDPIEISLHNQYSGLTHLSPHRVHHQRKSYPSAFHLLEALRFIDTHPHLAEQIRTCPNTDEVKAIVSQNSGYAREDWERIVVDMMGEVLYDKFIQHPHLRNLLLSTGQSPLHYADPQDNMWGIGPLGRGANELGRALERVRHRLYQEGFTMEDN